MPAVHHAPDEVHAIRLTSFPVARRKEIYEARWPETKKGGDRKSAKAKSKRHDGALIDTFAEDTASKTDKSVRTTQRQAKIGAALKDMAEEVAATPIAGSQKEMLALAKLSEKEQREVVAALLSGKGKKKIEERHDVVLPKSFATDTASGPPRTA